MMTKTQQTNKWVVRDSGEHVEATLVVTHQDEDGDEMSTTLVWEITERGEPGETGIAIERVTVDDTGDRWQESPVQFDDDTLSLLSQEQRQELQRIQTEHRQSWERYCEEVQERLEQAEQDRQEQLEQEYPVEDWESEVEEGECRLLEDTDCGRIYAVRHDDGWVIVEYNEPHNDYRGRTTLALDILDSTVEAILARDSDRSDGDYGTLANYFSFALAEDRA